MKWSFRSDEHRWTQGRYTTRCAEEHAVQGSCTTCQESGDEPKQDRDGSCETAVSAACKLVGRNAVWTLTQAGGDTTTWSVCTCWPEAVTTGASVCSCTAVTVPCACGRGRTIQYILRQVNIRQWSRGVPWGESLIHTLEPEICKPPDKGCR